MKNACVKSNAKCESPKTPGGISKSLLTPCRRVGLSRNWKKSGPSPFISPLSGDTSVKALGNTPVATEKQPSRRKKRILEEPDENTEQTDSVPEDRADNEVATNDFQAEKVEILSTPSRSVQLPRRKKSKKLTETSSKDVVKTDSATCAVSSQSLDKENTEELITEPMFCEDIPITTEITGKTTVKETDIDEVVEINNPTPMKTQKSPNNLVKECIVVLQNKMLGKKEDKKTDKLPSQPLFDSDSDDVPLCSMKKVSESQKTNKQQPHDANLAEPNNSKVIKLEEKKKSTGDKKNKCQMKKNKTLQSGSIIKTVSQGSNSFDDDDDDFALDCKRTILIRKSYDKVSKPTKSRTTGSITQKDIDDIKERINAKKNLLLSKVLTKDTEELRGLIKKWRKGCQDALTELIELMRTKFPDRQNMDYSEILQILRIPAELVGYDSDNDCFVSPDDASIVLSKFQ